MYRIKLTAQARKELKQIKKTYQDVIEAIFEDVKENPYAGKLLTRELSGKLSYKVSMFRIIYTVNKKDKTVFILTAGHRAIVYK